MSKLIKNSISLGAKVAGIFVLGLLIMPALASAHAGYNIVYGTPHEFESGSHNYNPSPAPNPKPSIFTIDPSESGVTNNPITITITGKGFVPDSVAHINGTPRPTTFIDNSHLLVEATTGDIYRTDGGFYVTVWNGAPGGGYSNAKFFKVNNAHIPAGTSPFPPSINSGQSGEDYSSLTSNAVFGSNSFLPSGIVQWLFFAIIVLLIVIVARKIFGGEDNYHAAPLKHD